jgi:hypothetical protein
MIDSTAPAMPATSMPDTGPASSGVAGVAGVAGVVDELTGLVQRLAALPTAAGDAERVDRIALLERLRGVVAAAQAAETLAFETSQRAAQARAGVPKSRLGRGIAEQVGLARRMSPASAARQVGLARDWTLELPAVYALLRRGEISEWAAQIIARETRGLPRHVRRRIADALAPDLPAMSSAQIEAAARRAAYAADPEAVLARGRTARSDRRVGLRPAPDTMALLSAFLPVEQGVAAYAALDRHAKTLKARGDPRSQDQIRADTLVERLTGQATADTMPIEIGLTMPVDSLFHDLFHDLLDDDLADGSADGPADDLDGNTSGSDLDDEPDGQPDGDLDGDLDGGGHQPELDLGPDGDGPDDGQFDGQADGQEAELRQQLADLMDGATSRDDLPAHLHGYGPLPAALARELALRAAANNLAVWIRRLFTDPVDETVINIDTRRRRFDGALARLIRWRDQVCTDAYCGAPIRHLDHTRPHRNGGPTTATNGAGLCERGNYTKDMPGWHRRTRTNPADGQRRVETTTPTGHTYTSTPPPALGPGGNHRQQRRRTALARLEFLRQEQVIRKLASAPAEPPEPPRRS